MLPTHEQRVAVTASRLSLRFVAAIAIALPLLALSLLSCPLFAQPPFDDPAQVAAPAAAQVAAPMSTKSNSMASEPRITLPKMPTLGGQVYWSDELVYDDWRIQRNTFTKHCRLLDGDNVRHASGEFEACQATLEKIKRERNLPPMQGKAVIVLHGLASVRLRSNRMASYLHEHGGYRTFCISYPSLYDDVGSHADSLASVIAHLDGIEEINLVAHSLGNLVIRRYWAGVPLSPKPDPRIRRIVMVGPPNHGAELAARFDSNPLVAKALGESGQQLGSKWATLEPQLATPSCEFGIIAGGNGGPRGYNPLLPGDNDGIVTVASARLVGARDFVLLPGIHYNQLHSPEVQQSTLQFLKLGYFTSEAERRPIAE